MKRSGSWFGVPDLVLVPKTVALLCCGGVFAGFHAVARAAWPQPSLRPAVVTLIAMMAANGTSVLRSVYVINRGYEDLATRLNSLGAQIETFRDI